ncbi:DNA replication licensing factor MCM5 [Nymphon striatum]|nr:DNA replication licensing factor MCM5 [Nymphon striatum]
MSETRWTEAGDIKKNKYRIIYSGGEKHQRGVGIILNKQVSKSLLGFWAISDRILLVKVRGNPFNISIIQVYAPTSASTDEEIELFYNQLDKAKEQCKPNEVQVIMGDFNAKVESLQEKPWLTVKAALQQAADETIPEIENIRTSKAWITKDILDMMEQRRMLKLKDPVHYRELDGNIKKRCNEAKENWLTIKCNEIENLKNKNDLDMYKRISEISGKRHTITSGCIRDENGKILTETADICKRWERYIDHLFEDEREELMENAECVTGPEITKSEITNAIKKMKKGKAIGPDEISTEMIQALGEYGTELLHKVFNEIYETGVLPEDMTKSIFITLPKQPGAIDCELHRTISIMSHLVKILLRVVIERIRNKLLPEISEVQYGYRKDKSTINAILVLRMLGERAIEHQQDVFICFIDYSKAFDKVQHTKLIKLLEQINIDDKDLRIIKNLYWNQTAAVKVGDELSEWKSIKRGVRQGCVMSPDLFNLYSEHILRQLEDLPGISLGGNNINNIRFADDTALIAASEKKLQALLDKVVECSDKMGLTINVKKTKSMTISKKQQPPNCKLTIGEKSIEQKDKFNYLGNFLTADGKSKTAIRTRIAMAKNKFQSMKQILTNRNLSNQLKIRLLKCYIWPVLMYGCETWTITPGLKGNIEAAEMWFLRRMFKISYRDRVSNIRVLERAKTTRELLNCIQKRQLTFLGHSIRRGKLECLALEGRLEGKRSRGRQRTKFLDINKYDNSYSDNYIMANSFEASGVTITVPEMLHCAYDRDAWKGMVGQVSEKFSDKSSKSSALDLPVIEKIDLCTTENGYLHHTNKYVISNPSQQLVIRRGEPFKIKITLDKKLDRHKHNLHLVFETGFGIEFLNLLYIFCPEALVIKVIGQNPLVSDDTQVSVICSWSRFSNENDWGAVIKSASDTDFTLLINTPSTSVVGSWKMHIHISEKKEKPKLHGVGSKRFSGEKSFTCSEILSVCILFNPWCKHDMVYMREESSRVEYVLNDWGKIWRGTNHKKLPLMWNYGQFEENILDASLHLLNSSCENPSLCGDSVYAIKAVSKQVVSRNGTKTILRSKNTVERSSSSGSWQSKTYDLMSSVDWQGTPTILDEWYKNRHHLPYSQCWLAAAILTTILRALGIPCRTVTGYATSQSTGSAVNIHIDSEGRYVSEMNATLISVHHVWTECWTDRLEFDKNYGGWQVMDISSHITRGPISLYALREGEIGLQYQTGSMFLTINCDIVYWLHDTPAQQCQIISVYDSCTGLSLSTRRPGRFLSGNMDREDVTYQYKNIHWHDEDRDKVLNSLHTSRSIDLICKYKLAMRRNEEGITVRIDMGYSIIGQTLLINLFVKNQFDEHHTIAIYCRVHSVNHMGQLGFKVKKNTLSLDLSPHQESIISVKIEPSEYLDKLLNYQSMIRVSVLSKSQQTRKAWFFTEDLMIFPPEINISVTPPVICGRPLKVRAHMTNPLTEDLTACKFILQGPGIEKSRHLSIGDVAEKGSADAWWVTVPRRVGETSLLATFTSHQLKEMSGFDDLGVFFSDNFGGDTQSEEGHIQLQVVKKRFKEFFRQFHEGNFEYKYRDQLRRNYNLGQYYTEVSLEDLSSFDESLADKLYKQPTEHVPLFEDAAKEIADEITHPRPEGEEEIQDIQMMLTSEGHCASLRDLKSDQVSQLVKIPGIVIAASGIKAKATKISIQCRTCRNVVPNISVKPGMEGYALPRKCNSAQGGRPSCPIDPYFIMPDKCKCVDYQMLKLQETPEDVPNSEMPRHMQLYCDRNLCEKIVPGNRVIVIGIYSIKKVSTSKSKGGGHEKAIIGIRSPYIRVIGIQVDEENSGRVAGRAPITAEEEEKFRHIAS